MGIFDFLKKKQLLEIDAMKTVIELLESNKAAAQNKIHLLENEIAALAPYRDVKNAHAEAARIILDATTEAESILRQANEERNSLVEQANTLLRKAEITKRESKEIYAQTKEDAEIRVEAELKYARSNAYNLTKQAQQTLDNATKQANTIIKNAHIKAEEIAGDAYRAQQESAHLSNTLTALRNQVKGYGDDYIIPTFSLLDQLAEDYTYTEAGAELKKARERSRLMVKNDLASQCDYVEESRRITAINFTTDAFNGKVDMILANVKQDNYGTLKQKIIDSFHLVNNLGKAFRNAVVTDQYLDSRLDELKWAVAAVELRNKEREEQRRIKEQIREEEKAIREFERAIKEAEKEEATIKKALEKVKAELESATESQRLKYEQKLAELEARLKEAESKEERAKSMAQLTKSGHVYVISNIGSFGENIYKIGMTRRLEPSDRVRELGDASVPFSFDIHAMIYSDNAPALENELHKYFSSQQVNKVNSRKEFFKVGIKDIRDRIEAQNLHGTWTMTAEAAEYKETLTIERQISQAIIQE